ncbi:MAG: GNAT family N-acetyltransferase, partial [Vicinamibacterales bacterium]
QDDVRGVLAIEPADQHLFVENVAVHPRHQGAGLGRRLMQFAEDRARAEHLSEIRLYTHERMTENITYYGKLGFDETDRRTEDGYQRVYMRKVIASQ